MSGLGQSRHFDPALLTSVLPRLADNLRVVQHVAKVPILLQKSGARDRVVRPFVRSNGLTPPALRLFTQLRRYAMHRTCAGGGRATRVASRRRFCAMAARTNSSWAPRGPRSRSRL